MGQKPHAWEEGQQARVLSGEKEGQVGQVLSVDDDDITLLVAGDYVVLSATELTLVTAGSQGVKRGAVDDAEGPPVRKVACTDPSNGAAAAGNGNGRMEPV